MARRATRDMQQEEEERDREREISRMKVRKKGEKERGVFDLLSERREDPPHPFLQVSGPAATAEPPSISSISSSALKSSLPIHITSHVAPIHPSLGWRSSDDLHNNTYIHTHTHPPYTPHALSIPVLPSPHSYTLFILILPPSAGSCAARGGKSLSSSPQPLYGERR